jgi:hypothetical protein
MSHFIENEPHYFGMPTRYRFEHWSELALIGFYALMFIGFVIVCAPI